jgi:3-deoxy-D-manno-octulosonate cytidylyltransferase
MNVSIVIPARMASTRFPGKPLVDLNGKPMIQWVYEAALKAEISERIIVAAPDDEILEAAAGFGALAVKTRIDHPSGTDRIAEVAEKFPADVYVNVQGDEPLVDPENIRRCGKALLNSDQAQLSSVYVFAKPEEEHEPAAVKVVLDNEDYALYFSRFAVPFPRGPRLTPLKKHLGLYGYRSEALAAFAQSKPSELELVEMLEQLRFLQMGFRIKMVQGTRSDLAVDLPEHAEAVRKVLAERFG